MKIENYRKDAYSLALTIKITEEKYISDPDNYTYYLNLFYKFLMSIGTIIKISKKQYNIDETCIEIRMAIEELKKYETILNIKDTKELKKVKKNCYSGLYTDKDKKYIQEQIFCNTLEKLKIMDKDTEIEELIVYRDYLDKKIKEKNKIISRKRSLNSRVLIRDYCDDLSLVQLLDSLDIENMSDLKLNGYKNIPEYYHDKVAFLLKFFDFDKRKEQNNIKVNK